MLEQHFDYQLLLNILFLELKHRLLTKLIHCILLCKLLLLEYNRQILKQHLKMLLLLPNSL